MGNVSGCPKLKRSRSLRDPNELSKCTHHRQSLRRQPTTSIIPTDAEIIDIHALRCSISTTKIDADDNLSKQLNYIQSSVRKDKGLFGKCRFIGLSRKIEFGYCQGMMTENLQNRHIFAADDPEDSHIIERTPEDLSMDYRSMYLLTYDGEYLHSYWIYQKENVHSAMTVLYFHGAGGNIAHRLEVLRLFYDRLNCNILIIDYRGFGKSSGNPTEYGLYIDAQTAYDYLIYKEKILPEKILVLGTSLGASVAIQLVSDPLNEVNLAIFENAFISIPEMAKYFLTRGKSILEVTKSSGFLYLFDSSVKTNRIQCSCMYLVGLLDPLVPPWMSTSLSSQTQHAKKCELFQYPLGKHNDLPIMENYFENIQTFLEGLKS